MASNTPSVLVALALLAGAPASAFAQGIVSDVGNGVGAVVEGTGRGVGAVVEGTGDALFGDRDTTVVVEEDNPDIIVAKPAPVIVEDTTPDAVIVEDRTPDAVIIE